VRRLCDGSRELLADLNREAAEYAAGEPVSDDDRERFEAEMWDLLNEAPASLPPTAEDVAEMYRQLSGGDNLPF
jgi:hypothetical protein